MKKNTNEAVAAPKPKIIFLSLKLTLPNAAISRREFDEISASIIKRWQISCVYNDKKRTLNPYKLINNNEIW
ncbi:hypothetical protein NYG85_11670, partial [Campylobacter sp. PS10]|nr:hypothetical protein [Campylobacter gastrosuis]